MTSEEKNKAKERDAAKLSGSAQSSSYANLRVEDKESKGDKDSTDMKGLKGVRSALFREEAVLKWLVRGTAVIVSILMAIFFYAVMQSSRLVIGEVEHIKDGPYPISVAAGHIETNMIQLKTVIEHLVEAHASSDLNDKDFYKDLFETSMGNTQLQIDAIEESRIKNPHNFENLQFHFELLQTRLSEFEQKCWYSGPVEGEALEEIYDFAEESLIPVIDDVLEINDGAIVQTSEQIEAVYNIINEAVSGLFFLSLVILIAVAILMIIYMTLLSTKTRFEKELREALTRSLRETREANEAKSSFLSNMSHDIRTPLNAIVGNTVIADENIDDKLRVKQCLTRISTSSQHLLSLINDVLDMNKIEAGKVTLTEETFSLSSLEDEIEMLVKSQPGSSKISCSFEMIDVTHEFLVGDTMRLKQILLNLTSNAVKYTNEGDTIKFIIKENPSEKSGYANITFIVEDTGIGMKADFVKRIFEPFERERNDFTIFTEGTGLGMAITKNLVDLMDGTIKVESELGIGTIVTINLDFMIASEADRARAVAARKGSLKKAAQKTQVEGNVLVVEDNEINMEIAKALIEARGATVEEAYDGLEAFQKVRSADPGTYDLIFMDMQMPHMDGLESTTAIRKFLRDHNRDHIPIVAMTANAFDSDRVRALEAGMDDFLSKPINVRQLEDSLEKYLRPVFVCEEIGFDENGDEAAGVAGDAVVEASDAAVETGDVAGIEGAEEGPKGSEGGV